MPELPSSGYFSEANSSQIVTGRLAARDGALPRFLVALVRHLHDLVKETRPTPAEWRQAIAFLTEVGHASDQKRQEWILLSDLLGVSALVEEINSRRPQGATPNTIRGPFYREDAPRYALGANVSLDRVGERLMVSGVVKDLDGEPVAGATVETWQANAQGFYENQQPDLQPEFNLRGVFVTDAAGRFHYETVRPAGYGVPEDGPVGQLLGRAGLPLRRPAHIHFMISKDGFDTITTHIYRRGDPDLGSDALFGVKAELVADFHRLPGAELAWSLDVAFVMVRSRKGKWAA
jgi:protocatechuate 3,4-dioxygenase beta subunit